jgi:hypothetical protein
MKNPKKIRWFVLSSITNCNLFCQAIGKIKHQKDADKTHNAKKIKGDFAVSLKLINFALS